MKGNMPKNVGHGFLLSLNLLYTPWISIASIRDPWNQWKHHEFNYVTQCMLPEGTSQGHHITINRNYTPRWKLIWQSKKTTIFEGVSPLKKWPIFQRSPCLLEATSSRIIEAVVTARSQHKERGKVLTSKNFFFNPFEKIWSSNWKSSPNRDENNKYLKTTG